MMKNNSPFNPMADTIDTSREEDKRQLNTENEMDLSYILFFCCCYC